MTTTTTVRPDTPIWTGGSTVFGAGNLATCLADDSDSNYAQTLGAFTKNRVRFDSLVVPAGAVVRDVRLRLRSRRVDGTTIMAAGLNLRTGIAFTPGNSVFTTSSSAPQPNFTAAQIASGVTLEWTSSGPLYVDLSEAYLDVTYVEQPEVDVTAPSGTIATTQPTIEWETSGDYPQSNWQAKIFTEAQFDAPGFDPTTSSAFYDTGVQAGFAQSHGGFHSGATPAGGSGTISPPQNLTNGGTYRYYVRAAQRVGSTTQWSDWDFEEILVSATVPDPPTITAVADDANARIKLTVTESDPWEFVTIERSSDGSTWEAVRSATRAPVFGATFIAYDYESCNQQDVQYRALAIDTAGDDDVASDWSSSTSPTSWTSVDTWLKSPTNPSLNATVKINELPTKKRRLPKGSFDVAGRADPVTVSDTRHLTEGTVTFAIVDAAALAAILALVGLAEVLLLQTPPEDQEPCLYMAVGDVDENRVSRRSIREERLVVCPFEEVLPPVGEIVGFGVTYDDVAATYADYDEIAAETTSYFDLAGIG